MLVWIVLIALLIVGALGFLLLGGADRARGKAQENAVDILDRTFDGRDDVTVTVNMSTLKYEEYVSGAKQRGYKLAHQAENKYGPHTLIFEKA